MTVAYDEILAGAEQLPLAEQARLVAQLASRIQRELASPMPDDNTDDADDDGALFFSAPHWAESEAEWEALQAELEHQRLNPPTREEAAARTQAMLRRWAPTYLSEEDALELAMSEELSEWNLDL